MTEIIDDFYIGADGRPYSKEGTRPYRVVVSAEIEDWFQGIRAGETIRHNEQFQEDPYGPYNGVGRDFTFEPHRPPKAVGFNCFECGTIGVFDEIEIKPIGSSCCPSCGAFIFHVVLEAIEEPIEKVNHAYNKVCHKCRCGILLCCCPLLNDEVLAIGG